MYSHIKEPASPQVMRARLKLSQSAVAGLVGVSLRTVQDWEQDWRKPSGPVEVLLRIAEQNRGCFENWQDKSELLCFICPDIHHVVDSGLVIDIQRTHIRKRLATIDRRRTGAQVKI